MPPGPGWLMLPGTGPARGTGACLCCCGCDGFAVVVVVVFAEGGVAGEAWGACSLAEAQLGAGHEVLAV